MYCESLFQPFTVATLTVETKPCRIQTKFEAIVSRFELLREAGHVQVLYPVDRKIGDF